MTKRLMCTVAVIGLTVGTAVGLWAVGQREEAVEPAVQPRGENFVSYRDPQHVDDFDLSGITFSEAPMLTELVARGELPPVEQRLPRNPVVVAPYEEIGTYGGTLNSARTGRNFGQVTRQITHPKIVRVKRDTNDLVLEGDLAEEWSASDDSTTFTFRIREGMRWSDGTPYTLDDIFFYIDDVMLNEELTPVPPGTFTMFGEPAEFTRIDDWTFEIAFPEPNPRFLYRLGAMQFDHFMWATPKHYMRQFHADYVSEEELDAKVRQAGLDSWVVLFRQKISPWDNPEVPMISPWITDVTDDGTGLWTLKRNPYYRKVDIAGNQLPYIDRIRFPNYANLDVLMLEAFGGNIDYFVLLLRADRVPVLRANQNTGNYRLTNDMNDKGGELTIFFNMTTEDEILREIFQDFRFRQAVSIGIDRQEIIDVQFFGAADIHQVAPTERDPLFIPELRTMFTEYDPVRANQLLDEMGLTQRDSEGYRVGPDGNRLRINFDYWDGRGWNDAYELIAEYMTDLGFDINLRPAALELYRQRATNSMQMGTWSQSPGLWAANAWVPETGGHTVNAYRWAQWLESDGEFGERPPDDMIRMVELIEQSEYAVRMEDAIEMLKEVATIYVENLWTIGVMGNDLRPSLVHNRVGNAPMEYGDTGFLWPGMSTHYVEQFFIRQ